MIIRENKPEMSEFGLKLRKIGFKTVKNSDLKVLIIDVFW